MKLSTVISALAVVSTAYAAPIAATTPTDEELSSLKDQDGPLPTTLPGADILGIYDVPSNAYPLAISNGTHYNIYLIDTNSFVQTQSGSDSLEKRDPAAEASPRWIWWQPFPGEPAWKKAKRDALPEAKAVAEAEAEASPRWIWWQPFPGEPAWKKAKRDALPDAAPDAAPDAEAEASPRWIWWQPFPGEPAWKKTKRDAIAEAAPDAEAEASPRWIWWQPFPGEPAWKKTKRDAAPEAEASPRWIWWQPFPGEPAW